MALSTRPFSAALLRRAPEGMAAGALTKSYVALGLRSSGPAQQSLAGSAAGPASAPRRRRRRGASAQASATPESAVLEAAAPTEASTSSLGEVLRRDFPILHQDVHEGMPLVYLDSAATSQKPRQVLDAMEDYYRRYNANVHRGVHTLSALATEEYERAREVVARLVGATQREELVFTRNASEAINLVAYSWGSANLKPGDEIVLTVAEHHSNLVPWQMVAQRTGAVLRFAPLRRFTTSSGALAEEVDVEQLLGLINERTRLVGTQHVSNVLGSELPVGEIVQAAHAVGAVVLLDACQSVPHMAVNLRDLDVDFAVASSHKMLGPTGIGFLYGKYDLLASMPPFLGGGEMIRDVFLDHSTYSDPPARFEAGTPAIAEAVGLAAAVEYMQKIPGGVQALHDYEMELTAYLYLQLSAVPGVRIFGPPPPAHLLPGIGPMPGPNRTHRAAALCAFNVEGVHPTDLSTFLDQQHGVAIRSGHHCAQPLHQALGVSSSARASLHCYNTKAEVDTFIAGLKDTIDFFGGI